MLLLSTHTQFTYAMSLRYFTYAMSLCYFTYAAMSLCYKQRSSVKLTTLGRTECPRILGLGQLARSPIQTRSPFCSIGGQSSHLKYSTDSAFYVAAVQGCIRHSTDCFFWSIYRRATTMTSQTEHCTRSVVVFLITNENPRTYQATRQ